MNQLIITIVYDPSNKETGITVAKLGEDKSVNLKDLLMALHIAEGQYIEALQITQLPEE